MSDLTELLERVKAATGPDREIDEAVYEAATIVLAKGHPDAVIHDCGTCVAIRYDGWPWTPTEENPEPGSWHGLGFAPKYSASVDAALELIKHLFPAACVYPDITPGNHACGLRYGRSHKDTSFSAGATPALSIVGALLSALIAQGASS